MIINVKGTSGSGKSTIIRKVMELYRGPVLKWRKDGRRNPICYQLTRAADQLARNPRRLVVPGHYETPCGGCDTITSYDETFELIRRADDEGNDVLFEGLLLSGDVNRTGSLHEDGRQLKVIALNLPLEECLEAVNARRRERNPDAGDVDPRTTTAKWHGVHRTVDRLRAKGVECRWANREEAFQMIRDWLQV